MIIKLQNRLKNLIEALEIERQYELTEYLDYNKSKSLNEKVKEGKSIYPLNYVGTKFSKFGDSLLEFEINENQSFSRFSNGSPIELFNINGESEYGIIFYSKNKKLSLKININDIEEWIKKGKLGLNLLPDTKTYDSYLNKLKSITDTDFETSIKNLYSDSVIIDENVLTNFTNTLNLSQNRAVDLLLNTDLCTTIIHGPPGTGKTTTLVHAITEIIKNNKKVIVCAPTNAAVDNICQKLINKKVLVCRVGNPVKVDSTIHNYTLDGLAKNDSLFKFVEQLKKQAEQISKKAFKFKRNFGKDEFLERKQLKNDLKSIRKDIKSMQKDIYSNILQKSDIICGTFVSVLNEKLDKLDIDYLFIDEAGQAIEPAIWSVSHLAPKLILAGDNFQLPPFVQSKKAISLGLNKSILDQAYQFNYPTNLLDIQYRMNDKIMTFSNQYFYNSRLISDNLVKEWTLKTDKFEAIEFIDTAGCGFEEQISDNYNGLKNNGEITIIEKRLKSIDINNNSYAIISPYRLQIQSLQSILPQYSSCINTIDSFQGQERDCIIISLVRSNESNTIGFLDDYRRMNVAMTRAKKKLIIIGDSATIGNDKFYNELLNYIEKNGTYRSAWEFAD